MTYLPNNEGLYFGLVFLHEWVKRLGVALLCALDECVFVRESLALLL